MNDIRYYLALLALIFVATTSTGEATAKDEQYGPTHVVVGSGFPDLFVLNVEQLANGRWLLARDTDDEMTLHVSIVDGAIERLFYEDQYGDAVPATAVDECPGGILGGVPMCLVAPDQTDSPFTCASIPAGFDTCVCICASN